MKTYLEGVGYHPANRGILNSRILIRKKKLVYAQKKPSAILSIHRSVKYRGIHRFIHAFKSNVTRMSISTVTRGGG